jgi:hypothetical protein
VSDLGLFFFFPSGNFERFFHFFRKKNKKAKRHPREEEEEEEEEEKVGISNINALYVNVCSLSIKTTLSLQNLLCIQIMRKKSSSSSDSDFLSLSVCYRLVYFISRRRRGCGYDVSTISLFYYNIIKQT